MIVVKIDIIDLFFILILHWVFDFIFQTDWQAKNKNNNIWALLSHVTVYTLCWIVGIPFMVKNSFDFGEQLMVFLIITFICHFITDFFTSKVTKNYFEKKNYHMGFIVVGFDQLLHIFQLVFTYKLVFY